MFESSRNARTAETLSKSLTAAREPSRRNLERLLSLRSLVMVQPGTTSPHHFWKLILDVAFANKPQRQVKDQAKQ